MMRLNPRTQQSVIRFLHFDWFGSSQLSKLAKARNSTALHLGRLMLIRPQHTSSWHPRTRVVDRLIESFARDTPVIRKVVEWRRNKAGPVLQPFDEKSFLSQFEPVRVLLSTRAEMSVHLSSKRGALHLRRTYKLQFLDEECLPLNSILNSSQSSDASKERDTITALAPQEEDPASRSPC